MRHARWIFFFLFVSLVFGVTACQDSTAVPASELASPVLTPERALSAYWTRTPAPTASPTDSSTPTLLPTPTSTPLTHVVQAGEDLFGISLKYGITLESLLAANPDVNVNFLSVGTVLVIPSSNQETPNPGSLLTVTPMPILFSPVTCSLQGDGGAWCFSTLQNPLQSAVESVSLRIVVLSAEDGTQIERVAQPLLNVISAGGALPVGVYFPAPFPQQYQVYAQLISALPAAVDDARYLPAHLENLQIQIDNQVSRAKASGEIFLDLTEGSSGLVWVLAAAYNAQGQVVGLRRWESPSPVFANQPLPFEVVVYSAAGEIASVEVFVEVRP